MDNHKKNKVKTEILQAITRQELQNVDAFHTEMETVDGLKVVINNPESFKNLISPENSRLPIALFISGTSESGKSTFGKLAVEAKIGHRLKIYATLADIRDEVAPNSEKTSYDYATSLEADSDLSGKVAEEILDKYKKLMSETDVPIIVVETIKHQWMVDNFKTATDIRFLSIFIDADLEKRIERESTKTGKPMEKVRAEVLGKDEWKRELGTGSIDKLADVHIVNNGSFETYKTLVVSLLEAFRENSNNYSGITHDYTPL